ncbi:MAG: T9SS type A sorting domain-containing protein [Bacteroidota bacterium]
MGKLKRRMLHWTWPGAGFGLLLVAGMLVAGMLPAQDFEDLYPDQVITDVQPMTGIVFWDDSGDRDTDVISLEFSYMLYNRVVQDSGVYNWDVVDSKLDAIAARKHQAILRFRFVYPGYETSVPAYILGREDYHETVGISEGKTTHFPDWTNEELQRFTLEFYTRFAERYDKDPRLAFIQTGFGLWAEYHIYDGPFILGGTFPSKAFQEEFFYHMASVFKNIPWSISIDAADDTYTPFAGKPELKNIRFGLFDDSFMHKDHSSWNELEWNFFDREHYRLSPAGGEFSYYSGYDQEHVLDWPGGPYGTPFETWAENFHITYMIGNDQPGYQTMERIREAGMATGYRFKIVSLRSAPDTAVFEITNVGVAPIYYDAFIAVDGVRSPVSLKLLSPGDTAVCGVPAGAGGAELTIECDKLVEGQEIQFFGTQELTGVAEPAVAGRSPGLPFPNPVGPGETMFLDGSGKAIEVNYYVYDSLGRLALTGVSGPGVIEIPTGRLDQGTYFLKVMQDRRVSVNRFLIL